jgi:putative Mg2+ transporter-C (MgtC) family protein
MDLLTFTLNVSAALLMGMAIGLERQWRQHPAGLRTNALVSLGAALFVSLTQLLADKDRTRIASYIVSGVGFLGGGVILREGTNVKGLATAATLWCSAAVGTLAGFGFLLHGLIGTLLILGLHLLLRPVAYWLDARLKTAVNVEILYRLRVICRHEQEALIRTILLRHLNAHANMVVQGISTQDAEDPDRTAVVADVFSLKRDDRAMQDLTSRLNIESSVSAVRWEMVR